MLPFVLPTEKCREKLIPITAGSRLEFTYAVEWVRTTTTFPRRFERCLS